METTGFLMTSDDLDQAMFPMSPWGLQMAELAVPISVSFCHSQSPLQCKWPTLQNRTVRQIHGVGVQAWLSPREGSGWSHSRSAAHT